MIELRRTAISIASHVFQRARLASDYGGNIEIIDVDGTRARAEASSGRDATGH